MARYRYQFCDLITDAHIVDLPLTGVSFDRRICQPGAFSGSMPITNRALAAMVSLVVPTQPGDLTRGPGRTICHVWRNEDLWGSYIIWSANLESGGGRMRINFSGAGLESWLFHRIIRHDLTYVQWDQMDLARDLVHQAQHPPGGGAGYDLGITGHGTQISYVDRDRTYLAAETASYGKRLEQLSEVDRGPEWMVIPRVSGGRRRREFHVVDRFTEGIAFPKTLSEPGNILSWSYLMDAHGAGTYWQTRGARDEATDEALRSTIDGTSTDHIAAGWPVLDRSEDYQGVILASTLNEYARWWRTWRSGITRILEVTARVPERSPFTPNMLGSSMWVTLINEMWPLQESGQPAFTGLRRVVGMEVTPGERGAPETARFIFEEPADNPRQGLPQFPPDWGQRMTRVSDRIHDAYTAATN